MANGRSPAARIGALEGAVAKLESLQKELDKVLEPHFRAQAELFDRRFAEGFREQAELIDRLFILRFEEWDKRWDGKLDRKLGQLEQRWEQKLDQKLEEKLEAKLQPLRDELSVVREGLKTLLARGR